MWCAPLGRKFCAEAGHTINSEFDAGAWDALIQSFPGAHLLQSHAWGEFKRRHGWAPLRVGAPGAGAAQILLRRAWGQTFAYVPRGPAARWDDPEAVAEVLAACRSACRARHAVFLRIEPNLADDPASRARLEALGLRPAPAQQPAATLRVDLTASEDEILARMKPKWRYNIRLAARRGVTARPATDESEARAFYRLLAETAARDNFAVHVEDYYLDAWRTFSTTGGATLLLAYLGDDLLGGLLAFAFGEEAIYMYGASSNSGREHMPNHLLQWEAMRWAKARGCAAYDLWGVPSGTGEDAVLEGVHRFKQGFGGEFVRYIGAFDAPYAPLRYSLGQAARGLVRAAR